MKKLLSIILVVISLFSLTCCKASKYQKLFCETFIEYALVEFDEYDDVEITSLTIYEGEKSGCRAQFYVAYREKNSTNLLKSTKDVTLVLEDITFNAEDLALSNTQQQLYGTSLEKHHGKTVEKGYYKITEDGAWRDTNYYKELTENDNIINTWILFNAQINYSIDLDLDKINKNIFKV